MRRRVLLALGAVVIPTTFAFACSLDLDESLIDRKDSGPVNDVVVPEGSTVTESGVVENPSAAACTSDNDCVTPDNKCLTPRCDLARRACVFEVCRSAACTTGKCDEAARTCSAPVSYKRRAGTFSLAQPFLCANCLVAAYPWVFAGTQGGVLAYNVSDPTLTAPPAVPIVGLGFVPNRMVRSGNRIWFAGATTGQAAGPGRFPLAYIEVPSDPFTGVIRATTVLVETKGAPVTPRLFARESRSILLTGPAPGFASAVVEPTVTEPASLTLNTFALPEGTDVYASSGTRLVAMTNGPGTVQVNLVSNAGAGTVTVEKLIPLDIGAASDARRLGFGWATSVDGSVFWAGATNVPVEPEGARTGQVKAYFLTADGKGAIPDAPKGVVVEEYPELSGLGPDADAIRFPIFLDNDTVMIATSAKEDVTKVAVNVVKRGDPPTVVADRRVVLDTGITTVVAASASDGIGYLGTNEKVDRDAASPDTGRVYVIAPECTP
ncbi:MAG: hypothetical protein KIT84_36485 [Labilithrix sp.]|nr:hypothetical protein [Labilithrix sp.]MCW5816554.1 hypothetical protein [Labilithrix sp.]